MAFAEHQKGESISLEWTHPPCVESAYIDKYLIYYCPVTECPGNHGNHLMDAIYLGCFDQNVLCFVLFKQECLLVKVHVFQ